MGEQHDIAASSGRASGRLASRAPRRTARYEPIARMARGLVRVETPGRNRERELQEMRAANIIRWSDEDLLREDIEGRTNLVNYLENWVAAEERSTSWARSSPATIDHVWRVAIREAMELWELQRALEAEHA